ncbi:hypothetical protein PF003_g3016 [Phytophthora fragariae]|nr:hypothetical protein PF003_g3016 [Phytophthora fragariae]
MQNLSITFLINLLVRIDTNSAGVTGVGDVTAGLLSWSRSACTRSSPVTRRPQTCAIS